MWLVLCISNRGAKKRPIVAKRVGDYLMDPELSLEIIDELLGLQENHYFSLCMRTRRVRTWRIKPLTNEDL